MSAALQRVYQVLADQPRLRVMAQALVSVALIVLLVHVARSNQLGESLGRLKLGTILLAAALGLVQVVLASCRWQILLRQVGIRESLGSLGRLYLIGQFFSLFLPTSTGGDAVRIYEVARRSGRTAETLLATLQERFLGLGSALLVGAVAAIYYLPLLPPELRFWAVVLPLAGAVALVLLLYPAPLVRAVRRCPVGLPAGARRWAAMEKLTELARPVADLAPLSASRLVLVLAVALSGTLLGVAMYTTVGADLEIDAGFLALCLVVPLVWVVRMAPVSLNGIGVGEGAFVFLMGLFGVPQGPALALALTMLGLQTCLALLGGLLLVGRMAGSHGREPAARKPGGLLRTDAAHEDGQAAPHRRAA